MRRKAGGWGGSESVIALTLDGHERQGMTILTRAGRSCCIIRRRKEHHGSGNDEGLFGRGFGSLVLACAALFRYPALYIMDTLTSLS